MRSAQVLEGRGLLRLAQVGFILVSVCCLLQFVSSPIALLAGIAFSVSIGNPFQATTKRWTPRLLQTSVVALGAGMNLTTLVQAGAQGFVYTVLGISATLACGFVLGKIFRVGPGAALLISCGTAICGGSAIAAVSSAVGAEERDISVSLVIVFLLNSLALLIFPPLGHSLHLNETQFGYWSALAIHDTSSVVGAALVYGAHAVEVATVTKLMRALWIVPLTLAVSAIWREKGAGARKTKRPWFILWFLVAAALVSYIPILETPGKWASLLGKRTLILTLFFIGSAVPKNIGRDETLRRAFAQGISLWILVSTVTLGAIWVGWIH